MDLHINSKPQKDPALYQ